MRFALSLMISFGLFVSATFAQEISKSLPAQELLRISPSGEDIPLSREIVLQFSQPAVPIGRMERSPEEVPLDFDPPINCNWRWLNTTSLSCQLNEADKLKAATKYLIRIKDDPKGDEAKQLVAPLKKYLAGKDHEGRLRSVFITELPKVTSYMFKTWKAPSLPSIYIYFNLDVSRSSVLKHVFFLSPSGERVPIVIEKRESEEAEKDSLKDASIYLISPSKELPLDSPIRLHVEPGLSSPQGTMESLADRVVVEFDTFSEFRFLGVQCCRAHSGDTDDNCFRGQSIVVRPGEQWVERCNPQDQIALLFSRPVPARNLKKALESEPAIFKKAASEEAPDASMDNEENEEVSEVDEYEDYWYSNNPHQKGREYRTLLPYGLRAFADYAIKANKDKLHDRFGTPLTEDLFSTIKTEHRVSRLVLDSTFATLEKDVETHLPVAVQNVDSLQLSYSLLSADAFLRNKVQELPVDKPLDLSYYFPLRVRDFIPNKSGVLYGSLDSSPTAFIRQVPPLFVAQVTPFHTHVKFGFHNTLVWVTSLDKGLPVEGAKVAIYEESPCKYEDVSSVLAATVSGRDGLALLPGRASIDPLMKISSRSYPLCDSKFKVRVEKNKDLAFVPFVDQLEMYPMAYGNNWIEQSKAFRYGHIKAWGSTPQGIYRLGQNLEYKIYVRDQGNEKLVAAPSGEYSLSVLDPTGKSVHERPAITLSEFGAIDGEFPVPESGAVGWYRFILKGKFEGDEPGKENDWRYKRSREWEPMQVLVSDFSPASFKVVTEIHGSSFKIASDLGVSSSALLYSGGPYTKAQSRITAQLHARNISQDFPKYESFSFGPYDRSSWQRSPVLLDQIEAPLNAEGKLESIFKLVEKKIPSDLSYGNISVETAVRDDRGKYVSSQAAAKFAARDRFVGIRFTDWTFAANKPISAEFVVIDQDGTLVPGLPVRLVLKRKEVVASRVKGPGNAYTTHFESTWGEVEQRESQSGAKPLALTFTAKNPGEYVIEAFVVDTEKRETMASARAWVFGKGDLIWEQEDGYRLDILPENTEAKVGEQLRVLVKNPYPGAQALITIERHGVIKKWFEKLESNSEIIKVPISQEMLPGFYLSVVVASPRVESPLGEGDVDLGKPAVRMGYAAITVRDKTKEISVSIKPERSVFKPREKVNVTLKASVPNGLNTPVEYAVAVLDEAVFDLVRDKDSYFDPYKGFYNLDPLDMDNYNLLLQLIGRRSFHKKGANSGGDGGSEFAKRSQFKLLAYWNPSIKAEKDGSANFNFSVPDNLTSWKILAIAVTKEDKMGLGLASIKVNQPTEIQKALVNQVIEGDSFDAAFTVMNRTEIPRKLNVEIKASGPVQIKGPSSMTVDAKPYERQRVQLPVKATKDGSIIFRVRAGDEFDTDSVELSVPVGKMMSQQTSASYGTFDAEKASEKFEIPEKIRSDEGSIGVVLSPSVISSVEGAFKYMSAYPYVCWEQVLTKGVMAAFYGNLRDYMPSDFSWPDFDKIPHLSLSRAANYQAPNGGMSYFVPNDAYADPYLSAYTAIAFNWLRSLNYEIPSGVEERLHQYLLKMLSYNSFPSFYSGGMSSTARAVALAALSERGKISKEDVERHMSALSQMSLFGKAHMALALSHFNDSSEVLRGVIEKIYSAANESGAKFMFNESIDTESFERILTTPLRDNCSVLSAFLSFNQYNLRNSKQDPGYGRDVPFKLARTISETRKNSAHWQNTQENIFCMNSLIQYSKAFETVKPKGKWLVSIGDENLGEASFEGLGAKAVSISRPLRASDPGKHFLLNLLREGVGRVYYSAHLNYSPSELSASPINAGIEVRREYQVEREGKWELLSSPFTLKPGELVRVDLYISIPSARNFVVVNDPIPGGLEPVNRDLATASEVDSAKGDIPLSGGSYWYRFYDWNDFASSRWSFYHKELKNDSARFYSEYLSPGKYHLAYIAQVIGSGDFSVAPTHVEEMYDPDVFGEWVPELLRVRN